MKVEMGEDDGKARVKDPTVLSMDADPQQSSVDELYKTGIPLRDLSGSEVHQFPGIRREHWW